MGELIFCLLLIMVFTGSLIFIGNEEILLNISETWSRKNLFGKLQIILLIIWLVPAILTYRFLQFVIGFAENIIVKTADFISDFVDWFIKLGNKK